MTLGRRFDVVIVGGGPAGGTAGALLAQRGVRVLVCEQKRFPRNKVCGEFMAAGVRGVLGRLGLLEEYDARAGTGIRRVMACGAEGEVLIGKMPGDGAGFYPKCLSRDVLDEMILRRAGEVGAEVWQPCHVSGVEGDAERGFVVATSEGATEARAVVLAHGLAQRGGMGRAEKENHKVEKGRGLFRGGDASFDGPSFLCFKRHFVGCDLAGDVIAIAGTEGIYAGLVRTSDGEGSAARYSLAFAVRKGAGVEGKRLGDAEGYLGLLCRGNRGFGRLIGGARGVGDWYASGPMRPGVRKVYGEGRFFVGNAAGEVHALVGEGITLAMRGGELLADRLGKNGWGADEIEAAGRAYESAWRGEFAGRYRAANFFAGLICSEGRAGLAARLMEAVPGLFDVCIRMSGKVRPATI